MACDGNYGIPRLNYNCFIFDVLASPFRLITPCHHQVGVATDTARRIRAEQAMSKYQDVDKLYDQM